MTKRCHFVSDLHLFSRRSLAEKHGRLIHEAVRNSHTFVLGGDIFDFRWSTLGTPEQSVAAAIAWLDRLVRPHPDCQFHFVLGNHDFNHRFLQALDSYSAQADNLQTHHYCLRMGQSVFLHGDAVDHPAMCADRLKVHRRQWLRDEHRSPVRHLLYDWAVKARLHKLTAHVMHPHLRVTQRLGGYLERIGQGATAGVEQVYFGHTHKLMDSFRWGGMAFHNGGAPMAGLPFRILPVGLKAGEAAVSLSDDDWKTGAVKV